MKAPAQSSLEVEFSRILWKTGAVRFGTFTLTSGKLSPYYIDLRIIPSFPEALTKVIEYYKSTLTHISAPQFDRIAGVPTAGLIYSSLLGVQLQKPLLYVRKEAKDWGREKRIEGLLNPGETVLIIDDVATTGKSMIEAAAAIRGEGGMVQDAVVLVDRQENAEKTLKAEGITLHSFVKITDVARILHELEVITQDKYEAITRQIT